MDTIDELSDYFYTKGLTFSRDEINTMVAGAAAGSMGQATAATDPGVMAPGKTYSFSTVGPSAAITFSHFPDNAGNPIVIPAVPAGSVILEGKLFCTGTFWVATYLPTALPVQDLTPLNNAVSRIDKNSVFSGASIESYLFDFLLDIKISGLAIAATDVVHVFWVFRNYLNGSSNANSLAIGVNGVRVASWTAQTYAEPAADAKGNIFDILSLTPISSNVTATAYVNWAKFTTGTIKNYNSTGLMVNAAISPNIYNRSLINPSTAAKIANLNAAGVLPATSVSRGSATAEAEFTRLDKSSVFQGSEIDSVLMNFLLDVKFFGLSASASKQIKVYQVWRGFLNSSSPNVYRWVIDLSFADGTRFAHWTADGYAEPAADADGNIFDVITIPTFGNGGISAQVSVNWAAITSGIQLFYTSAGTTTRALISARKFVPQIPAATVNYVASQIARGTASTVDKDLTRLDNNRVFKGSEIEDQLANFLLDISITGLVVSATDVVHVFYAWRNYNDGTASNKWVLAIGINGVRCASATISGYTEPTADASGRVFDTLTLTPISGVANNTNVRATARVDWSALTTNINNTYDTSAKRVKGLLSPAHYSIKVPSAASTSVTRIENNNILQGDSADPVLANFILDLKFQGNPVSPTNGQSVHVFYAYRNYNNVGAGGYQWLFALAIDETRFVQFNQIGYTEPAAQVNGDVIDTITLSTFGSLGITVIAKVNWAAITAGSALSYSGSANYLRSLISPNIYRKTVYPGSTVVKSNLPATTDPRNIYTVLNDVDPRNVLVTAGPLRQDLVRNYAQRLYVDHSLINFQLNTDVRWSNGSDKMPVASPRNGDDDITTAHPAPSVITAKTFVVNGGVNFNNKNVSFNHVSTLESTGADTMVAHLKFGDSTVDSLNTEIGVPDGYARRNWAVIHEQFLKCKIDYLLKFYNAADIQTFLSGGSAGPISSGDQAKYRSFAIGTSVSSGTTDTFNINYRGVQLTKTLKANGLGGWNYNSYMNKPILCAHNQGVWDVLGLGNGTGTDYTGTASQILLMDRTPWSPSAIVDTAAMRAWAASVGGYIGSTRADYVTWATNIGNNPEISVAPALYNPFYDATKNTTYTDANSNVWTVRFSIAKYLARYRTMTDAGVRLAAGDGALGSLVTDRLAYDVFKPTHISFQSCQNDGNVAHFGLMAKAFADAIKAEYTANSWGTPVIILAIVDGAGTYFPNLYPEVDPFCSIDEFQRAVHNDNLARLQASIISENTNKVFVLAQTHISPTAKAIVTRNANSPEYDLSLDEDDMYGIASRTSLGIKAHQNAYGHRCWGIHEYALVKYTLGL